MRTQTIKPLMALAAMALLLVAAPLASAKSVSYKGKTKGGSSITFKRSGNSISKINSAVPVVCVSSTSSATRAGADIYQPGGSFRLGTTGKRKIKQRSAMAYSLKLTKNYKFTSKRGRGGKVTGKLDVNFSYLVPSLYSMQIFICQGVTNFSAMPR